MKPFSINPQQIINLEQIQIIDDGGWDIRVTMLNGRELTVSGNVRMKFLRAVWLLANN